MSDRYISGDMVVDEVIQFVSDGNQIALEACEALFQKGHIIDADAGLSAGPFAIMQLNALGIFGVKLARLWQDICHTNPAYLLALVRANQRGGLAGVNKKLLHHAIEHDGEGLDLPKVMAAVQQELPNFNRHHVPIGPGGFHLN